MKANLGKRTGKPTMQDKYTCIGGEVPLEKPCTSRRPQCPAPYITFQTSFNALIANHISS